ncbi:MAG TPA: hypothetical protein VJQ25_11015, partial [Nitrospira sp.]|nr:hypothetical protein [Nitrospira sp.]
MQSRIALPCMLGVLALLLGSCKELEQVTKQTLPVVGQALPVVGQAVPGADRYIGMATTAMDAMLPI